MKNKYPVIPFRCGNCNAVVVSSKTILKAETEIDAMIYGATLDIEKESLLLLFFCPHCGEKGIAEVPIYNLWLVAMKEQLKKTKKGNGNDKSNPIFYGEN